MRWNNQRLVEPPLQVPRFSVKAASAAHFFPHLQKENGYCKSVCDIFPLIVLQTYHCALHKSLSRAFEKENSTSFWTQPDYPRCRPRPRLLPSSTKDRVLILILGPF